MSRPPKREIIYVRLGESYIVEWDNAVDTSDNAAHVAIPGATCVAIIVDEDGGADIPNITNPLSMAAVGNDYQATVPANAGWAENSEADVTLKLTAPGGEVGIKRYLFKIVQESRA